MNSIRRQMALDHQVLAGLLRRLAEDAAAPSAEVLDATWAEFEPHLMHHFEAEERYLLPLIEADHPSEVERIRLEHARIRNLVTELGVRVELHTARQAAINDLIELLRAHAAHEDEALYQWAGDKASSAVEHSVTRSTAARHVPPSP